MQVWPWWMSIRSSNLGLRFRVISPRSRGVNVSIASGIDIIKGGQVIQGVRELNVREVHAVVTQNLVHGFLVGEP